MTQLITSLGIVGEEFFVCKENHQKGCVGERESYSGTTTREGGKRSAINIRSKVLYLTLNYWNSLPCYNINGFRNTNRMRWLLLPHLHEACLREETKKGKSFWELKETLPCRFSPKIEQIHLRLRVAGSRSQRDGIWKGRALRQIKGFEMETYSAGKINPVAMFASFARAQPDELTESFLFAAFFRFATRREHPRTKDGGTPARA